MFLSPLIGKSSGVFFSISTTSTIMYAGVFLIMAMSSSSLKYSSSRQSSVAYVKTNGSCVMLTTYSFVSRIFFSVFDPSNILQKTLSSPRYLNPNAPAFLIPSLLVVVVMHSYYTSFLIPSFSKFILLCCVEIFLNFVQNLIFF